MKISAMWEEGGTKTPASPARVVQYEGAHLSGHWILRFDHLV